MAHLRVGQGGPQVAAAQAQAPAPVDMATVWQNIFRGPPTAGRTALKATGQPDVGSGKPPADPAWKANITAIATGKIGWGSKAYIGSYSRSNVKKELITFLGTEHTQDLKAMGYPNRCGLYKLMEMANSADPAERSSAANGLVRLAREGSPEVKRAATAMLEKLSTGAISTLDNRSVSAEEAHRAIAFLHPVALQDATPNQARLALAIFDPANITDQETLKLLAQAGNWRAREKYESSLSGGPPMALYPRTTIGQSEERHIISPPWQDQSTTATTLPIATTPASSEKVQQAISSAIAAATDPTMRALYFLAGHETIADDKQIAAWKDAYHNDLRSNDPGIYRPLGEALKKVDITEITDAKTLGHLAACGRMDAFEKLRDLLLASNSSQEAEKYFDEIVPLFTMQTWRTTEMEKVYQAATQHPSAIKEKVDKLRAAKEEKEKFNHDLLHGELEAWETLLSRLPESGNSLQGTGLPSQEMQTITRLGNNAKKHPIPAAIAAKMRASNNPCTREELLQAARDVYKRLHPQESETPQAPPAQ